MELCSFLLSAAIVGAYETRPGIMYVEYLENEQVEEVYVYTDSYLTCWNPDVTVPERGTDDGGGGSTATNSWLAKHLDISF